MAAKDKGFWDFKAYDEKTWFRFLIYTLFGFSFIYVLLHVITITYNGNSNYEYARLSQDQMQQINRIYIGDSTSVSKKDTVKINSGKVDSTKIKQDTNKVTGKPAAKADTACAKAIPSDGSICNKVMHYVDNIFDGKIDKCQEEKIHQFLCEATPREATDFLNGTRFRIRSSFWLIGPSVYWEVYFWAIFGVLSSLLFSLGAVGSNATSDLGNPKSQFDSSEIYGQVAKLFYAPLCTLSVVFGYNYFKDASIVDISSSKGVIVFAFIGGFYSSRIIALMDRLKDVLLPNSGLGTLPTPNTPASPIPLVTVKVGLDPTLSADTIAAITPAILNTTMVTIRGIASSSIITGTRNAGDPDGVFSFSQVQPGNYVFSADLKHTPATGAAIHLTALLPPSNLLTCNAPISMTLK